MKKVFLHFLLLSSLGLLVVIWSQVNAEEKGKSLMKEKTLQLRFNSENSEGNLDLKKLIADALTKPEECNEPVTLCKIDEVTFDMVIKKKWLKLDIPKLTNYEFANTVPVIKNDIDQLTKPEIVILQEVLSRRGLLKTLDGKPVYDRGFLGSLTWMGLVKLAKVKGLNPGFPQFKKQLQEKVNELLKNMAKDIDYTENHPLPKKEDLEPQKGDKQYSLWEKYQYLSGLAQTAEKVSTGDTSVEGNTDVKIDGYVNVERIKK